MLAERGFDDTDFREIGADEAAEVAVELFGDAELLHAPTIAP